MAIKKSVPKKPKGKKKAGQTEYQKDKNRYPKRKRKNRKNSDEASAYR